MKIKIAIADKDHFDDDKTKIVSTRQMIKLQSFLEDKDAKVVWHGLKRKTKELEIKQVEFKLGEDCWDIKSKYCCSPKYCSYKEGQRTA